MLGQVPLAETGRGIAFGFQNFRNGYFFVVEHRVDVLDVPSFSHPKRLATRHDGGPRGPANRLGVETGESHAFLGHAVNPWGANVLGAKATGVGIAHVVGKNHDEVDWFLLGAERDEHTGAQEDDQGRESVITIGFHCDKWSIF